MGHSTQKKNNFMFGEYCKVAEQMFPSGGFSGGKGPNLKTVAAFAEALGIGTDYQRLLALKKDSAEMKDFLEHFQNNLDLLIQKTWIEKSDERRKEKLQDEAPALMITIAKGDFHKAIEEFSVIIQELAYLFFGSQCDKDDFTEYTFRIDAQMGLFWWYGGKLSLLKEFNTQKKDRDDKVLWAVLLLGLCYLTNF